MPIKLAYEPVPSHKENPLTGISEVLVLILLICGILIIPRMLKPAPASAGRKKQIRTFGPKLRAGIVISVIYPVVCTLIIKPWQGDTVLFISVALLPVALAWALVWILSAKKN